MIIAFAFGIIAALLVLANSKHLRNGKVSVFAFVVALGLSILGIYLIKSGSKESDSRQLFPLFVPLAAFLLYQLARILYRRTTNTEIILHMHGLIPMRQESRYVTRLEKSISFLLLVFSVMIPYLILIIIV
jgi:hypothetical protein